MVPESLVVLVGQHLQRFIRPWCQLRTLQCLTCRRQLTHSHQQLWPLRTTLQIISIYSAPPASSHHCLFVTSCAHCQQLSPLASILPCEVCATTCEAEGETISIPVLGGTSPSWPLPMQIGAHSGTAISRLVGRSSSRQPAC